MKRFWEVIVGIFLILYIIAINLVSGTRIAFSLPVIILGIVLILYHFIKAKIKESYLLSREFKVLKIFMYIAFICFL